MGEKRGPYRKPQEETPQELDDRAMRLLNMAVIMNAEAMRLYARAEAMRRDARQTQ
jgi:hypothetical protein